MLITDESRRRRLVARHHLGRTAAGVEAAVRDVVVLHSSDPATPHLALWARVPGFRTEDLDAAICEHRTLWRLHAMRRTIWVAPTAEAPVLEAAAGRKVAATERRRLEGWLGDDPDTADAAREIDALRARILDALAAGPCSTRELTKVVDGFDRKVVLGAGKWVQRSPIGPRVLYLLAMELEIVRGANSGTFRSSQYEWARTDQWFDQVPERLDVADAQRRLCSWYLLRFGPVTTDDIRWWTGWTKGDTQRALDRTSAAAVQVQGGDEAWVHPDDPGTEPAAEEPCVSLLPSLDPTAMGWRDRGFYLDDAMVPELFDRNGNVGPTVWVDGRIVGGWYVGGDGTVATVLLTDVGSDAAGRIEAEVEQLGGWLDEPVTPRFPTPLERRKRAER